MEVFQLILFRKMLLQYNIIFWKEILNMNREEFKNELKMTYEELQCYLIQKYGSAKCDYFVNSDFKSKNRKVTRTSDGLYCHHMDEDKGGNLGNPPQAKLQPFEWQKKERLVYCNILEHLILHMKIAILRQKKMLETPIEIRDFFTTGGIFMICEDINDMFMFDGTKTPWKKRCFEEIKENYEDYVLLIKSFMKYIETDYKGNKTEPAFLVPGSKAYLSYGDCEILKISPRKDAFLLKLPSGEEKVLSSEVASSQFTYTDQFDLVIRMMASGYENFYTDIYKDIITYDNKNLIEECSKLFKIDYQGYGFAKYADIKLDESFGSLNADEYISRALPMYCENVPDIKEKNPRFWKGEDIPKNARKLFYVVRIKTSFSLKEGMEPFIRYRKRDILRENPENIFSLDNNRNLKDRGWTILATSDIYYKKTNKYYSKYIDIDGSIVDATVTISLGKDDYLLFKERYNIRYIEILDGCYFE